MPRRRPRKMNPNSLKNLKPGSGPGDIRNPKGIHSSELGRVSALTNQSILEIGTFVLEQNVRMLKDIIEDSRGPDGLGNPKSKHGALKVWMAQVALRGITKGDYYALDVFLNRIVGKPRPPEPAPAPPVFPGEGTAAQLADGRTASAGSNVLEDSGLSDPTERRLEIERYRRMLEEVEKEIEETPQKEIAQARPDIEVRARSVEEGEPHIHKVPVVEPTEILETLSTIAVLKSEAIEEAHEVFDSRDAAVIVGSSD